jgi:hypothetical protein
MMAEGDNHRDTTLESDDEEVTFQIPRGPTPPIRHAAGDGPSQYKAWDKPIKIETFSGEKQPWRVWHRMFERIAGINKWEEERANRLFSLLRGPALEVACGLPDHELEHYDNLVHALDCQFGPARQAELHLAELRNRKKKPEESFRELGRAIKRLSTLAYDTSPYEVRERLAKADFIAAIPDKELKIMILQGKPSNLEEAVGLAEENAGYRKWAGETEGKSKSSVRNVNNKDDETLISQFMKTNMENMQKIQEAVSQLTISQNQRRKKPRSEIICYNCSQLGHYSNECTEPRHQGNDQRPATRGARRS